MMCSMGICPCSNFTTWSLSTNDRTRIESTSEIASFTKRVLGIGDLSRMEGEKSRVSADENVSFSIETKKQLSRKIGEIQ